MGVTDLDRKHNQKVLLWIASAAIVIGQGTLVSASTNEQGKAKYISSRSSATLIGINQTAGIDSYVNTSSIVHSTGENTGSINTLYPSTLLFTGSGSHPQSLGSSSTNNLANPLIKTASTGSNSSKSTSASTSAKAKSSITTTKTDKTLHTLSNLKSVKLTSKSVVKLTDLNVLTQEDGKTISYTLTYQNNDSKNLMLIDYWTKVKTKGGTLYSPNLITRDKDKKSVAAGSTLDVTYLVKVGKSVNVSDLLFQIVKWDFSKPNYESSLGHFNVPASYTLSTPVNKSKSIRLGDTPVKVKVTKLEVHPVNEYNYAEVTVNLHNVGYKMLENPTAKWVLRTAGGSNYPLIAETLSTEAAPFNIQPQENKTIKLLATIPKAVKLTGAELVLVEEEGEAKTVLPLATLELPKASTTKIVATAPFKAREVDVDGQKLQTTLEGATVNQSYDKNDLSIRFHLKNTGKQTITVPKYEFVLLSGTGKSYPITTKALENVTLKPDEEKTIKLDISVSYAVAQGALKLQMNVPKDPEKKEPSFSYPAGVYILPKPSSLQNTLGSETTVKSDNGTYAVTWSSIQRLPWTDGDLLSAKLTVKNTSVKTLRLPELQGAFTVDSAKDITSTKLIKSQAASLLGPGQSIDLYLLTKVPTSLDIAQLQVSLEEKVGEESFEWLKLTNIGAIPDVPKIEKNKEFTLTTLGKKAEVKTRKTVVYPGTSTDLVYTELEVTNLENRQTELSQLSGYYQSSSGLYFKTNVKQIEYPAGPEDKSIVTMWAKVPKRVTVSDMRLIVGEGVTEDKLTSIKEEPTGYVNAASLEIAPEQLTALTKIDQVELYPYQIKTNNFDVYLSGSSNVAVEWYYTLTQDDTYDMPENEHKLVVEIADSTGRMFTKELIPATDLKLGTNQLLSWTIDDRVFEDRRVGTYHISIYDMFQGEKYKIAGESIYYNTNRIPLELPRDK